MMAGTSSKRKTAAARSATASLTLPSGGGNAIMGGSSCHHSNSSNSNSNITTSSSTHNNNNSNNSNSTSSPVVTAAGGMSGGGIDYPRFSIMRSRQQQQQQQQQHAAMDPEEARPFLTAGDGGSIFVTNADDSSMSIGSVVGTGVGPQLSSSSTVSVMGRGLLKPTQSNMKLLTGAGGSSGNAASSAAAAATSQLEWIFFRYGIKDNYSYKDGIHKRHGTFHHHHHHHHHRGSANDFQVRIPYRMLLYTAGVFIILPLTLFIWKEMHLHPIDKTEQYHHHHRATHPTHVRHHDTFGIWLKEQRQQELDAADTEDSVGLINTNNTTEQAIQSNTTGGGISPYPLLVVPAVVVAVGKSNTTTPLSATSSVGTSTSQQLNLLAPDESTNNNNNFSNSTRAGDLMDDTEQHESPIQLLVAETEKRSSPLKEEVMVTDSHITTNLGIDSDQPPLVRLSTTVEMHDPSIHGMDLPSSSPPPPPPLLVVRTDESSEGIILDSANTVHDSVQGIALDQVALLNGTGDDEEDGGL